MPTELHLFAGFGFFCIDLSHAASVEFLSLVMTRAV
jgi:hypothetical protein